MKDLFKKCPECDASGYVTIDINDTDIPYEQNEIDFTCMVCDGTGGVVDKDELLEKIDQVNDLIQGMQVRMRWALYLQAWEMTGRKECSK